MLDTLRRHWGYTAFRPLQADIIGSVLEGRDTLGLMATGGGKSITFQVPALMLPGLTLVVTPLISLMKDQVDNLLARGIRAYFLHAGLRPAESRLIYDKCRLGKARILYVSPEKLQSESFRQQLSRLPVSLIVVDEAHCISQWGYDFRPSYLKISELRKKLPDIPVLALTASATPEVVEDICRQLEFRTDARVFRLSFNRTNLNYIVRRCDLKEEQLIHIASRVAGSGIVYVRSRKRTRQIAEALAAAGISADFYHAGLAPEEKAVRQNRWKTDETRIMVATTAFGMGIDKPDVRLVVHFDPPSSLEEYYQEAGRGARDGKDAYAVSLVAPSDKGVLTRRLNDAFPPKEYIREVYNRLCVFLNIYMGEGFGEIYEFNLEEFCRRNSLQPGQASAALKILTQSGWIEYIEEIATRSRLMVVMTRRDLYDLRLDPEAERVFQHVLRTSTGIFADYEHIDEPSMASALGLTEQTVYENLLKLSRMHVISYVPRKSTPYIVMSRSRQEGRHVQIPREVYEERRERMAHRIETMKRFLFANDECRNNTLLRYFGEKPQCGCGKCDVCRSQRATHHAPPAETIRQAEQAVVYALTHFPDGVTVDRLAAYLATPAPSVIATVRALADRGELRFDTATLTVYPR